MRRWLSWRVVLAALLGTVCGAVAAFCLVWVFRGQPGARTAEATAGKAYVVSAINWEYVDRSEPLRESEPGGAGFPRKVFADRAAAEAFCRDLDRAARKDTNPFMHGQRGARSLPDLCDYTSTPTGDFIDWLEAEGLAPPPAARLAWEKHRRGESLPWTWVRDGYSNWWGWWHDNSGRWTAEQRERVWDKLDRVRFFEVFEVEADR